MRFYFDPKKPDVLQQLSIHMANAQFNYGFEYLGVQDKLVQTPLTDRLYLTMTQALEERLGGSPFGQCTAVPPALCNFVLLCTNAQKNWRSGLQFMLSISYICLLCVCHTNAFLSILEFLQLVFKSCEFGKGRIR